MVGGGLSQRKTYEYHATSPHATLPRERVRTCWRNRTSRLYCPRSTNQITDGSCSSIQLREGDQPVHFALRADGQRNYAGIFHDHTDTGAETRSELGGVIVHSRTKP